MDRTPDLPAIEKLRDGREVTVRPLVPTDRARLVKAFAGLDAESVYSRFFSYKSALTEAELDHLFAADGDSRALLVAASGSGGDEAIVATARYDAIPEAPDGDKAAEVAFVVEEDFHQQGLASRLLAHLVRVARDHGFRRFVAEVLPENGAMLAVFARSGLPMTQRAERDATHVELEL